MRWEHKEITTVVVGTEIIKTKFLWVPLTAINSDGIKETRWLEKAKISYRIYEKGGGWTQTLGKTIQKRHSYEEPIKFLD